NGLAIYATNVEFQLNVWTLPERLSIGKLTTDHLTIKINNSQARASKVLPEIATPLDLAISDMNIALLEIINEGETFSVEKASGSLEWETYRIAIKDLNATALA